MTCKPEEFVPDSGDAATAGRLLTDEQAAAAARQPHLFTGKTIIDQLEAAGHSWKAYMEAMPATDKLVEYAPIGADGKVVAKLYAQKHNPFVYFDGVRSNAEAHGQDRAVSRSWQRTSPATRFRISSGSARINATTCTASRRKARRR